MAYLDSLPDVGEFEPLYEETFNNSNSNVIDDNEILHQEKIEAEQPEQTQTAKPTQTETAKSKDDQSIKFTEVKSSQPTNNFSYSAQKVTGFNGAKLSNFQVIKGVNYSTSIKPSDNQQVINDLKNELKDLKAVHAALISEIRSLSQSLSQNQQLNQQLNQQQMPPQVLSSVFQAAATNASSQPQVSYGLRELQSKIDRVKPLVEQHPIPTDGKYIYESMPDTLKRQIQDVLNHSLEGEPLKVNDPTSQESNLTNQNVVRTVKDTCRTLGLCRAGTIGAIMSKVGKDDAGNIKDKRQLYMTVRGALEGKEIEQNAKKLYSNPNTNDVHQDSHSPS